MCTGLDCPEVHADCSGCDDGSTGTGGGDDTCVEKEPDSCDVPWEETQSGGGGSGPTSYCGSFGDTTCALGYYYLLAACAGQAPVPSPDQLLKGTLPGDVQEIAEKIDTYLEAFGKKKLTLDDIVISPGIAKVWETAQCGACVEAVNLWASFECPGVVGRYRWQNDALDFCTESTVGGEGDAGLYKQHEETIDALLECEGY